MSEAGHRTLSRALARTIINPEEWDEALHMLCGLCGAQKALITRREKKGARIIVPTRVSDEWQSPLVYGFSEEEVFSFLEDFQDVDPWTPIEARHHPYPPYEMSRYFPLSRLKKSDFWSWLEPQGIVECISAEIDKDAGGWTGLNLYLSSDDPTQIKTTLRAVSEILPELSSFWQVSKELFQAKIDRRPLESIVEHLTQPSILIGLDAQVIATNMRALDLQADGVLHCTPRETCALPRQWKTQLPAHLKSIANQYSNDIARDWRLVIVNESTSEFISGEQEGHHLLLFVRDSKVKKEQADWLDPALNEREKILVRHLAKGGQVKDGAELFGISVRANSEIWKSAKIKLGGIKKQDLKFRNTDFLQQ